MQESPNPSASSSPRDSCCFSILPLNSKALQWHPTNHFGYLFIISMIFGCFTKQVNVGYEAEKNPGTSVYFNYYSIWFSGQPKYCIFVQKLKICPSPNTRTHTHTHFVSFLGSGQTRCLLLRISRNKRSAPQPLRPSNVLRYRNQFKAFSTSDN